MIPLSDIAYLAKFPELVLAGVLVAVAILTPCAEVAAKVKRSPGALLARLRRARSNSGCDA